MSWFKISEMFGIQLPDAVHHLIELHSVCITYFVSKLLDA